MALSLEDMVNKFLKYLGPELEEKTNTLQRKIELLTSRKDDALIDLQQEAYSDGKKRKREVEDWLINVEDIIKEFETLKQKIQCCKFYARQNLTQQVEIMTKEVTELLEQSDFPKGLFLENRPSRCLLASLKILEEDEISRIGILGLGRLGKTTLSKQRTVDDEDKKIIVSPESMENDNVTMAIENASRQRKKRIILKKLNFRGRGSMVVKKIQRTKTEKQKREIAVKPRRELRRSETDNFRARVTSGQRQTTGITTFDDGEINTLSNEEFQRTVEAFIQTHWNNKLQN